tara:strand:+ start:352 stop:1842 length:1491 start_codon:yes stop_codon:yes gene_type:complete
MIYILENKWIFISLILLVIACETKKQVSKFKTTNVLFIAVDDLRPELGIYGNQVVKSPNIDQLARDGSFFSRHYVQVPTCGASRYSLMTGLRPRKKIHIDNRAFYSEMANHDEKDQPESIAHHFRRNGYTTVGIGKLSHSVDGLVYGYKEKPSDVKEMPHSWDRFIFNPGKWKTGWNAFFAYANGENRQSLNGLVKPYESIDIADNGYPDGLILNSAVEELKKLKAENKPFFLGVGFFKPHLPFNAPKKYWDLYERSSIQIASDPLIPKNVHPKSVGKMGEFYNYKLSDEKPTLEKPVSDDYARKLIHGYYASISYVDHLIGQLLKELKGLDLDKNTLIVLWGDHGWHLGNDRKWGKHSLFERSLKSALIVKLPGVNHASKEIKTIVETVDLYPTLLDFCGIGEPYELDGKSLVELIQTGKSNHRNRAFSFWKNGVSLKTDRYRLTKFFRKEEPKIELYDHLLDPDENINIAFDHHKTVDSLMPALEKVTPEFYFK